MPLYCIILWQLGGLLPEHAHATELAKSGKDFRGAVQKMQK